MKLFGTRTTTVALPARPREPMTSDSDLLAAIWTAWLTAQPLQDQQALARREWNRIDAALARELAADPVRKLLHFQRDPSISREARAIADWMLDGYVPSEVPPLLGRVADMSDVERRLTATSVRDAVAQRITPAGADAAALLIAWLVGTELEPGSAAPRRLPVARGVIFVTLRDLGLPIHTWEGRLIELDGTMTPERHARAAAA